MAYTSILKADNSPLALASEHLETEKALKASGIPFVLLEEWLVHRKLRGKYSACNRT